MRTSGYVGDLLVQLGRWFTAWNGWWLVLYIAIYWISLRVNGSGNYTTEMLKLHTSVWFSNRGQHLCNKTITI